LGKKQRIIVGPGRGSAAGSLVAYLLNITNVDPLKNELLFERFLNPSRISMPDIDLDFTDRRRDEVINYVAQKYGRGNVAQIITFGTMASRAVIRDVGRALRYDYSYCDKIAKMIPFGFTLKETLKKVSEFKDIYETDEQAQKLIDLAKKLEGVAPHASTHACGVVISDKPLLNLIPLQHPTQNDKTIVTQYEMHAVEDLGILKMDFLGLKNLTIIEDTLSRVYVVQGKKIDIEKIPLDDKETFKLLQKANTTGVFQLESSGMQKYLLQLKPTEFEDIVAMVALYRPGPMQFLPDYVARKQKKQEVEYLHPKLKPILEKTQGICIYQEQLMQIAQKLAGFSLAEADVLRKAVGKKIENLLRGQEEKFIKGMIENGIGKNIAQKIWQWILPFAEYGFNKCVTGDTKIINSETGQIIRIKEIAQNPKTAKETFSISDDLKIKRASIVGVFPNGKKPVFEIKTRSGRKITTTANHPFLSQYGWRNLENIKIKEKIAVPRQIPQPKFPIDIEDYKIATLGYLLSEGNFCHPSTFYFYSKSEEEINDYLQYLEKFSNTVGRKDYSKTAIAVNVKRINIKNISEAVKWIWQLGLKNKKATQKFIPDFVFRLSNEKISLLIGKMFQGDGCINLKRERPQIFYATSSKNIAESMQYLLLRFGIISTIHEKKFKYRNSFKAGYTINISRHDNIQKFIQYFEPHLLNNKKEVLNKIKETHLILNGTIKDWSARGSKDTIPKNIVLPLIRQIVIENNLVFANVAETNGFSKRLFLPDSQKIGYLRETVGIMAMALNNKELKNYSQSDIFWDEVISITPKNEKETFNLIIEGTHNFVANNIFVHNSHSVAYATIAYQTAYLKTHFPVEFMASLLTSEKNDIERIAVLIENCKKMRIEVLPPNINESLKNFTVVPNENKIRFGLLAIKNVGENVIDAIVEEIKNNGPFKNIENFVQRINSKNLNKKSMESLIRAGAFDEFSERQQLLYNLERLLEWSRENQKNKINGQKGLFEKTNFNEHIKLAPTKPATNFEKLTWEKELLGLYVSSHPLEDFRDILSKKTISLNKIKSAFSDQKVLVGGIISNIKKIITKNGKPMLFLK